MVERDRWYGNNGFVTGLIAPPAPRPVHATTRLELPRIPTQAKTLEFPEMDGNMVLDDGATDSIIFQENAEDRADHPADSGSKSKIRVSHSWINSLQPSYTVRQVFDARIKAYKFRTGLEATASLYDDSSSILHLHLRLVARLPLSNPFL